MPSEPDDAATEQGVTLTLTCPSCGNHYEHTILNPSLTQRIWYTIKWKLGKAPNCGLNCGFNEIEEIQDDY